MADLTDNLKELYNPKIKINENMIVFWINAFIPKDTTKSKIVPAGPHQSKTMIPASKLPWADCILTDQRGFSSNIAARVRMQSVAVFEVLEDSVNVDQWHRVGSTIEIDCEDGDVESTCTEVIGDDKLKFTDFKGGPDLFKIGFTGAAKGNACSSTKDIDYEGTIMITSPDRTLHFDGKVDNYPNFEAYVQKGSGQPATIFQYSHKKGASLSGKHVIGSANNPILKRAKF